MIFLAIVCVLGFIGVLPVKINRIRDIKNAKKEIVHIKNW